MLIIKAVLVAVAAGLALRGRRWLRAGAPALTPPRNSSILPGGSQAGQHTVRTR